MRVSRVPGLGGWGDDPLWAVVYDWTVEHPRVGRPVWWAGMQSDLRLLYAAADEIGRQPRGSRILDVPCGGGVALRGLRRDQAVEYVAADISQTMLDRTMEAARERHVADQVTPVLADVADLPLDEGDVDLVVTFTGLHCFPDPEAAVTELARVLRVDGVITGSTLLNDSLRYEPLRRVGRLAGLLGPGCTSDDIVLWLTRAGVADVTLEISGAIGYFRGVKRGSA